MPLVDQIRNLNIVHDNGKLIADKKYPFSRGLQVKPLNKRNLGGHYMKRLVIGGRDRYSEKDLDFVRIGAQTNPRGTC